MSNKKISQNDSRQPSVIKLTKYQRFFPDSCSVSSSGSPMLLDPTKALGCDHIKLVSLQAFDQAIISSQSSQPKM